MQKVGHCIEISGVYYVILCKMVSQTVQQSIKQHITIQ